jgi:hypothetical protein
LGGRIMDAKNAVVVYYFIFVVFGHHQKKWCK